MNKIQSWKIAKYRAAKRNRISPFAPSKKEVIFYESFVKKVKYNNKLPNHILILGATPELRDGVIKNGLESYAVDLSRGMLDKFTDLMKYKGHNLDRKIIRNWLKMKFPKNHFGAVLGDASLNNLATREDNEKLVKILKRIIAPGGYLVLRQVVYPKNFKAVKSAGELIKLYHQKKITWPDFFMELRAYSFKKQVYNKKTYQYDVDKNFKLIDKLFKDQLISKKEYQKIITFRNDIFNIFYPEKEFIKMVEERGFRLIKIFHDKGGRLFKYLYSFAFIKK